MAKWSNPEIFSLGVDATKGNFCNRGNDNLISDCIENASESIFGDHSGPFNPKPCPPSPCPSES